MYCICLPKFVDHFATCYPNCSHPLNETSSELDTKENEIEDYHRTLLTGGKKSVTVKEVKDWLKEDESDPGYHIMIEQ